MVEETRVPENTGGMRFYEVEEIHVGSWTPKPDGLGKCTQVHMRLTLQGNPVPFVVRFKSPRTISDVIDALMKHRKDVWNI